MRYIKIVILFKLAFLSTNGYCEKSPAKVDTIKTIFIEDENYWHKVNPIMFLDTLKKYPGYLFIICINPNQQWFKSKFKKTILISTKSQVVCGKAISVYQNNISATAKSDIGIEATKIIDGINAKRYPPY